MGACSRRVAPPFELRVTESCCDTAVVSGDFRLTLAREMRPCGRTRLPRPPCTRGPRSVSGPIRGPMPCLSGGTWGDSN